jgi:hypothetical protein
MSVETVSYMMLFCAILMARNRSIAVGDSVKLVPLSGGARTLADQIATNPPR